MRNKPIIYFKRPQQSFDYKLAVEFEFTVIVIINPLFSSHTRKL